MTGQPRNLALRLGDALLAEGASLDAIRYSLGLAIRERRRNAQPTSPLLAHLYELASAPGQADMPGEPIGEPEYMPTGEVGRLLGCSDRHARRLAPLLGGRLVGGRLLFDRRAVEEHVAGMNEGN